MPYKVAGNDVMVKVGKQWVRKYHHKTHADAVDQLRALYANVPDAEVKSK